MSLTYWAGSMFREKQAACVAKCLAPMAALLMAVSFSICAEAVPSGTAVGRVVTFDDLDGVRDDSDTQFVTMDISADGRFLAVARGQVLKVLNMAGGQVMHTLGEGLRPRWSPSGDRLAFYSIRSGKMQLWLWSIADGSIRQITNFPGGVDPDPTTRISGYVIDAFDYSWSPDGDRVVFASRVAVPLAGQPVGGPLILDRTTAPELTLAGIFTNPSGLTGGVAESPDGKQLRYRPQPSGKRLINRLFVTDLRTHETTELDAGMGNLFHPQWCPDGRRIAFAAIDEADEVLTATSGEIRVHEVAGGGEVVVASGPGLKYQPRWSSGSERIAYLVGGAMPDFAVVSPDGADQETLAFGRHVRTYRWTSDGDSLLLTYPEGTEGRLGRLDLELRTLEPMLREMDIWWLWAQAHDETLVWMEGGAGPDIWIQPVGTATPSRLTTLATDETQEHFNLGRTETIRYRTSRGDDLEGALLFPPDYDPDQAYPMIVDVYPLSRGGLWMHPMLGNQAWAAADILVFKPYARAPHAWINCSGDAEFCRASRGPEAWEVAVDDVMAGVDEVVRRGLADPQRICAYGFSNGGGLASYLVTRTDRFACAVIIAPAWPSWIGAPLLAPTSWHIMADWVGVDVLTDPAAYVELSAIFRARDVTTPVMLVAGDEDGAFLLGAIEMYNALRFAGADVTLLRYPGQGHIFKGDGLRDLWKRKMTFFDSHLNPD